VPASGDPRVEPEDDENPRVNVNAAWYYSPKPAILFTFMAVETSHQDAWASFHETQAIVFTRSVPKVRARVHARSPAMSRVTSRDRLIISGEGDEIPGTVGQRSGPRRDRSGGRRQPRRASTVRRRVRAWPVIGSRPMGAKPDWRVNRNR
jgi:hypothetical protein